MFLVTYVVSYNVGCALVGVYWKIGMEDEGMEECAVPLRGGFGSWGLWKAMCRRVCV